MKQLWLPASMAMVVAALLVLPSEAQKGKGGGKSAGKSKPPQTESKRLPTGDKAPARLFDHPKSGNSLPQEVRDKLPPGLRDKPENHPGLANHLRKMDLLKDHPAIDPIPPEVRSQLPPGLRDRPYDHPGVANHLGKLGWSIDEDGVLVPPATLPPPTLPPVLTPSTEGSTPPRSFQPFGGLFRRR
jgi:hypothetical protein